MQCFNSVVQPSSSIIIVPLPCFVSFIISRSRPPFIHQHHQHHRQQQRSATTTTQLRNNSKLWTPTDFRNQFPFCYEPRDFFQFEILYQSSKSLARVGRIHTPHGSIDTPGYVPVATNGALKGVDFQTLDSMMSQKNKQLVFCNTYHLLLHPGSSIIKNAGGIHQFTGRISRTTKNNSVSGPFITDSGGFQVFSMAHGTIQKDLQQQQQVGGGELKRAKVKTGYRRDISNAIQISENGVVFKSYRDGSSVTLTPESTIQAQKDIGADIIIPLDELPPYHTNRTKLQQSLDRTHRWECRSLVQHLQNIQNQAMYCVIHGGTDVELRTKSINYLTSLPFDGYAIGGSLGSGRDDLKQLLSWMMPLFASNEERKNKPRHLLGIGDETSIVNAIPLGIDTCDSCYPTKLGRHGTLLTRNGLLRIKRGKQAQMFGHKIDEHCNCPTCQHYDRAYLNHLFKSNEPLAVMLATQHNLYYMQMLMEQIRQDILDDKL